MNPIKAGMFTLSNKVGTANVGRKHGLFNQLVGIITSAWHDFFNMPCFITDDLGLDRLEVDRAAALPGLEQGLVDIVQIEQVRDPLFALDGFRAAGIGQNRRHFGVGETCMAEHHRREKLVSRHFAILRHQHVTNHAQALNIRIE